MADPVAPATTLPLFYRRLERLNARQHGDLGIVSGTRPQFARACNAVPLAVSEMASAMATYPIVFMGSPLPIPVAIMGLQGMRNIFVSEEGLWSEGAYIPAYVRRYPFMLVQAGEGDKLVMAVDPTSDLLAQGTDRPLFQQGQPTETTQKLLQFCQEYQKQMALTEAFSRELVEAKVLEQRAVTVRLPDGRAQTVEPVTLVSSEKLDQVPEELFASWRRRGLLPLIYWHLGSQAQWQTLAARHTG